MLGIKHQYMNKIFFYCVILFLIISCSENNQHDSCIFHVNEYLIPNSNKVKLSGLFSNYRIIPLETNDASLIGGRGNKVIQRDSLLYIHSGNSVLCFGADGHFIYKFDKHGSGPEDYVDISDFDVVSPESGKCELWIAGSSGIQIYDANNGTYLRKIYLEDQVLQFKFVNNNTILFITTGEKIFHVCNKDGTVRKSFMEKDLANSVHKFCQFFEWQGKIAYQLGDTQTAIVYDPQTDECSMKPILLPDNNVLTPEVSCRYYKQYGYLKQYDEMTKDYTLLLDIRTSCEKATLTWISPGKQRLLTLISSDVCSTYYFSDIINDIFPSSDNLFLATLTGCESDSPSRLLFKIPSQRPGGEEDNFWLLEADL